MRNLDAGAVWLIAPDRQIRLEKPAGTTDMVYATGKVRLAHRYQHCEDWPNSLVLIAALKESVWAA